MSPSLRAPRPRCRCRCRTCGERGSALVLVPAGLLVLMLLAALAVDSAGAYLGQQQLHDALSAAANDAVAAGIDRASFYSGGAVTLDPAAVRRTVCLAIVAQNDSALRQVHLWMSIRGDSVHLEGTAVVEAVFGRFVPGFGHHTVRSYADAVAETAPGTAAGSGTSAPGAQPPGSGMSAVDCGPP